MPSKNCLKMNTAKGEAICGRIMPRYVSTNLSDCISANNGTMSTCPGIMIPARMIQNSTPRPRKGMRENAYAAMLANTTVARETTTDVKILLKYHRGRSLELSVLANACKVKWEEIQVNGMIVVSLSGLSAVSRDHASGINQRIVSTSRIAKTPELVNFRFICAVVVVSRACITRSILCVAIRHLSSANAGAAQTAPRSPLISG